MVSIKTAADKRRLRGRKIIDEKREMCMANNGSLRNTSTDLKGVTFLILKNHASAVIRKEKLSSTNKTNREASRNTFVKKDGMPDSVESLGEVDCSKNRKRARLGFVKPIQNELRKKRNLIKSRPSRAETGRVERENGIRLQKQKYRQ